MNRSTILYACMLLISCNPDTNNTIPDGIYTCIHEHEFARTEDTFKLERINDTYFHITRHAGITGKMNGKMTSKQLHIETWKLEYDNAKKAFTELKTGKVLIWHPDKQALILGNKEYLKR